MSATTPTSKQKVASEIVTLLCESGLSFEDQVKAISMARVAIQPRASEQDWRTKAKPILRPKEKKAKEQK